ncbi:origin recognition complex subunit 6 [Cavenderia fasciculata]|uniref:Origin recognition complex subunit 6 n=1 Tax=Cavenderia fasciculata TaxID=261658 RepID=F4PX61_CACFS|nr:origin recognition complex subunit 6 [Cavenderia fasciculata]EGG19864.1 origin recognition complex subunit 6 [Cavenderia fasciculata]|eukprot:XP_004358210.1 origin recognition complex subunit 6 [Cavenderia fasciculata]
MQNQIDTIADNLHLGHQNKVISYAKELYRKSVLKIRNLGQGEVCRPAACLLLSLQSKTQLVNDDLVKALIDSTGSNETFFFGAVRSVQNALDIKYVDIEVIINIHCPSALVLMRHLSVTDIANEFKLPELIEQTENLLGLYRQKLLAGIEELQRQYVDFENAEYTSAAFYVMTQQNDITIDVPKLASFSKISQQQFQNIVNSITSTCYQGSEAPIKVPKTVKLSLNSGKKSPKRVGVGAGVGIGVGVSKSPTKVSPQSPTKVSPRSPTNKSITFNNNNNNNNDENNSINLPPFSISNQISPELTNNNEQQQQQQQQPIDQTTTTTHSNQDSFVIDIDNDKETTTTTSQSQQLPIINKDGKMSIEEEKKLIKRQKDQQYDEWKSSQLSKPKPTISTTATKQSTLDSFFTIKKS